MGKQAWVEAKDLHIGDLVLTKDVNTDFIHSITHKDVEPTKVYNLEVEDNHTYFVGDDGVLVHNYEIIRAISQLKDGSIESAAKIVFESSMNFINGKGFNTNKELKNKLPDGVDPKDTNVRVQNLSLGLKGQISIIRNVFEVTGYKDGVVITSGNDGIHGQGSYHYKNNAIDLRTKHLSDKEQLSMANKFQATLGKNYRVISEYNPDPNKDHIHVQEKSHKGGDKAYILLHEGAKPSL